MPVLARGNHRDPRDGACLMEYTAILTGERFTDHPPCTHPVLAELARQVNDLLTSTARPSLVTRAPVLASIGRARTGVSAAVTRSVLTAHAQYPRDSPLFRRRARRMIAVVARDTPGRGWWGRRRDTLAAYDLVYGGLQSVVRRIEDPALRNQVLLDVLDRALEACSAGDLAGAAPRPVGA